MSAQPSLLLIEHDPAVVHILKATLTYGGYRSDGVPSGIEAVERLRNGSYDAVILDPALPDLGGVAMIRMIRTTTNVPILILSGEVAQEEKIAALDAGADDFIQKPFLPGELLARIRAALRRGGEPFAQSA